MKILHCDEVAVPIVRIQVSNATKIVSIQYIHNTTTLLNTTLTHSSRIQLYLCLSLLFSTLFLLRSTLALLQLSTILSMTTLLKQRNYTREQHSVCILGHRDQVLIRGDSESCFLKRRKPTFFSFLIIDSTPYSELVIILR